MSKRKITHNKKLYKKKKKLNNKIQLSSSTIVNEEVKDNTKDLSDTEVKVNFCKELYEKIKKAYTLTDTNLIKQILADLKAYFVYKENEDYRLEFELLRILRKISNDEVKPTWTKSETGISTNIYVGLQYKNIVFSLDI